MEPIDSLEDLRRVAANAGRYGVITVPAAAVLDLVPDGSLSGGELADAIDEAEDAARCAASAADDAQDAADALEDLIEKAKTAARQMPATAPRR